MGEPQTSDRTTGPATESNIEKVIHDYILAHPEVLIEALQLAKRKQEDQLAADTKSLIRAYKAETHRRSECCGFWKPKR